MAVSQSAALGHARSDAVYQPRRPEQTTLYQILQRHWLTFAEEISRQSAHGNGMPDHVKAEVEAFLRCGILSYGFARLRCAGCGYEQLLPFSCKSRGFCPSCTTRRMAETAAHLVDQVLPDVPYRQWTLSLPRRLRFRLAYDGRLLTRIANRFLKTVFAWQKRAAKKQGIAKPLCASVTFIQRFGSLLQLNVHFHTWLPDGVFYLTPAGTLAFHKVPPPTDAKLAALLEVIRTRLLRVFENQEENEPDDDAALLMALNADALESPLCAVPPDEKQTPSQAAFLLGFSLHAGLAVPSGCRKTLERLLRYGIRPPFAQSRLSVLPNGQVRLRLRKPYGETGQTEVRFAPHEFLRRLCGLIPPPRQNQIRFHGLFAPHQNQRALIQTLLPKAPDAPKTEDDVQPKSCPAHEDKSQQSASTRHRQTWAALLKRVFGHNLLCCPKCQSPFRAIAVIEDPKVITRILTHLGLDATPPQLVPARAPPELELFDDFGPEADFIADSNFAACSATITLPH